MSDRGLAKKMENSIWCFNLSILRFGMQKANKELDVVELKKVLRSGKRALKIMGGMRYLLKIMIKRVVSTWGNDQNYWLESATAFGSDVFSYEGNTVYLSRSRNWDDECSV